MVIADIISKHKLGDSIGITSICSAHPFVLKAGFAHARTNNQLLLIESTCNQVNQFGGYTGKTPDDFAAYVETIANDQDFPMERLVLGGDHLGPNPWTSESASLAMQKATTLVADCVRAGYTKIHLDASMGCIDDDPKDPSFKTMITQRTAELCSAAEKAFESLEDSTPRPIYIIGSEVPTAGGALSDGEEIAITSVEDVQETIELTQRAFLDKGLQEAWERVVAVVVQPGVEFSANSITPYNSKRAEKLSAFIEAYDRLVYEAHSTDYQTRAALKQLVDDHFAILKVGPALTYAFREGLFSLEMINNEMATTDRAIKPVNIRKKLEEVMISRPIYWQAYYTGNEDVQKFDRLYSLSDRARYYWSDPSLVNEVDQLIENLTSTEIPYSLLSQFLPLQHQMIRDGKLNIEPEAMLLHKITQVLADYTHACGMN